MKTAKIYKKKVETIKTILGDYETRNELNEDDNEDGNNDVDTTENAIYARLKKAHFKYNLNICKDAFFNIIAVILIFVLISIVYKKFFETSQYLQITLFLIPAIFSVFTIVNAFRNFKDKNEIVHIIDHKMGLKERLITSLEFAKSKKKSKLYNTLVSDAVNLLSDKRIKESLDNGISKRNKILVILIGILGLAAIFIPPDQLLTNKPSYPNMSAALNTPVVSPSPVHETEVVKQEEEEEKQDEVTENKQVHDDVKEESREKENKLEVAQSEEEKLEKDINDIMKRILSLLNNYSGSDDLEIDSDSKNSQPDKSLAQTDQNQEQDGGGRVSKSEASDGTKQEPEAGDTADASKDDVEQGQETANNLLAQKQQDNNKSNQSGNNGMNPPPGISGSPQNNTKGSGTGGTGSGDGGSSQTAANTNGNTNREKQKNDMSDRESSATGSARGESVASAGNSATVSTTDSSTDRTSKSSQTGMDKRGNKGDQSDQNNSDINTKSGKKGGTEVGRQVASGEKSDGEGPEADGNKIDGQDKNQSQAGKGQKSVSKEDSLSDGKESKTQENLAKGQTQNKLPENQSQTEKGVTSTAKDGSGSISDNNEKFSVSDNNEKISDSDTTKSGKDDKKTSGGLGSSDSVSKLDKDVKSGDKSGKDNSGKNGEGIGEGLQNENADTTQKDSSSGKSGSSDDNQKGKTNIAKDTRNINQSMSGAKAPSSGEKKGKQSASKGKSGQEASGGEIGKDDSSGTKLAQNGKQETQSGTKRDNLSESSRSDKNGDIDIIKKDIANLLNSVENKIEDYEKKEKSQLSKGKQDIEAPDTSQSGNQETDKAEQISANNQKASNTGDKKSNDSQPGAGSGNESANKLYSEKGENIDFDKGEEFEMFIEGEQDTHDSQKRDVELYGTKLEVGEWARPGVPVDVNASRSRHQSKDDAIKNTQIPGEYEKIIKGIYLNNN